MISLEMLKEGYEGIPATAKTLTEDDLRQWVKGKDVSMIPLAVAAIKAAQASISVSKVYAVDEHGEEVTALTVPVGDVIRLKGLHDDPCACVDTSWTANNNKVELVVDGSDSRLVEIRALAAGSVTLTCNAGSGSGTVALTIE